MMMRKEYDRYLDAYPYLIRRIAAPFVQRRHPELSTCQRCHVPWFAVSPRSVMYNEHSGMFPICQACWDELNHPGLRLPYYLNLFDDWQVKYPNDRSDDDRKTLIKNVIAESEV